MTNGQIVNNVIDQLTGWSRKELAAIGPSGVYVFGSLIYRKGEQFGERSDIDLVVVVPTQVDGALKRVQWLESLLGQKRQLETDLAAILGRKPSNGPICSVVAVTTTEIALNVHKDGAVGFFTENQFYDLRAGSERKGLPSAGSQEIAERLVGECIRFAQKKRNQFLNVSADGSGGLEPYSGEDPLPKDIMRHAAMARQLQDQVPDTGAEYDVQYGLDFMTHFLYEAHRRNSAYEEIQKKLSIRRGARGTTALLTAVDQMLLAEIIFGIAVKHLQILQERADAELPSLHGAQSTVEFSRRFAQAFPGVRGIEWYTDTDALRTRLERLMQPPLEYAEGTPIWWWRDGNLQIEAFKHVEGRSYLRDGYELHIRRIAAVNSGQYDRVFVYVEIDAMKPTGLYKRTPEWISEVQRGESFSAYAYEEYALVDGVHLVNRGEYDDGAAIIDGELQDIRGRTELRTRYVTPYNFVIAAHGSPFNDPRFDEPLEKILDAMLKGEDKIEELMNAVRRLPKRPY